jgi:uncharacterized membrane protein YraQ (UPF0718 family)
VWTIYLYEISFAAVVLTLLTAGVIGLWSREFQRPSEGMKALSLTEQERVSLRNARDANVRLQAQAKVLAEHPDDIRARQVAKKAAKAARKLVIRQAAGKVPGGELPDQR